MNIHDFFQLPVSKSADHAGREYREVLDDEEHPLEQQKLTRDSKVLIKDGDACYFIELGQVRYFEICGNYTRVFFDDESPFIYKSLSKIAPRLPEDIFFRVSRQHIVNLEHIENITSWMNGNFRVTMSDGAEIEVSRRSTLKLKSMFSI